MVKSRDTATALHCSPPPITGSLPQPPHVAVLIRVEAVGVVAAVLDVIEPAAVNGGGGVARPGAGESVHRRPVSAGVAAALRAHSAAAAADYTTGEAKKRSRTALSIRRLKCGRAPASSSFMRAPPPDPRHGVVPPSSCA